MRLRLARICGTGDVLAEHAAFRRQRPEFFDVVNRGTAVSFALLDDPQFHHLVICLISRQADNGEGWLIGWRSLWYTWGQKETGEWQWTFQVGDLENVNITHWAVMPKAPEAGA